MQSIILVKGYPVLVDSPPGPGLCALILSLLSLLLVAVTLPISLCLCIKVIIKQLPSIKTN